MKLEIIPGSVTRTHSVHGCSIAESNVPGSALRPNSSDKLYFIPTAPSTVAVLERVQRGISTAKGWVLPGVELLTERTEKSESK